MTSFGRLLLCAVAVSSSAALAHFSAGSMAERTSFKGSLLQEAEPVRYSAHLSPGLRVAQAETGTPVSSMTREQLQAEYASLESARPGIGGKIAMIVVGSGMIIFGVWPFIALGAAALYVDAAAGMGVAAVNTVGYVLIGIGAALVVGGVILAVVGGIKLGNAIRERSRMGARMDEIQRQIDTLDAGGGGAAVPPPSNVFFPVQANTVIARF